MNNRNSLISFTNNMLDPNYGTNELYNNALRTVQQVTERGARKEASVKNYGNKVSRFKEHLLMVNDGYDPDTHSQVDNEDVATKIMVFLQMEQTRIEQTNRQKGKTSNGFSTIDTTRTALLWYYETTHNCGRDYNLFTNQGNN
jgi:uncharacterized protein with GYD domain